MKTHFFRFTIILSLVSLSQCIFANQDIFDAARSDFDIPQEILDRLPEEQVAPFVMGRNKMLESQPAKGKGLDIYQEINVSQNTIARVPDDQLYQFFVDLGYIEGQPVPQTNMETHNGNAPPSPEQLIQLILWLIGAALLVILVSIYLAHRRRIGEQEIVLRALETGEEIPLSLFNTGRQKTFMRWGILFLTSAAVIIAYGIFNQVSISFTIIPASFGAGLLLAGILVRD